MAETPYTETEAFLMVLRGDDVGEVLGYLWEHFNVRELGKLLDSLVRLERMVVNVKGHKYHALASEVASPGEG
jgi:hypothetical protein